MLTVTIYMYIVSFPDSTPAVETGNEAHYISILDLIMLSCSYM